MKLVIVESPTKAKTLSGILGKEYKISASMGHIRDLPKSGLGVDVEHNFKPEYVIPEKSQKLLNELISMSKDAEMVVLATDPDREGEAIAWHLSQAISGNAVLEKAKSKRGKKTKAEKEAEKKKKPKKVAGVEVPFERVVFHELTKPAIEEAFNHPGVVDLHLVDAQQARRVLDRLVGYKLSPLLWKKVRYGLSAGRVQSVAVRLIVEKERERQAFKPEEYWSLQGEFTSEDKKRKLLADLATHKGKKLKIDNDKKAKKLEEELKNDSFSVLSVKKTERKKNTYPPYKTSTLQQAMSNVFGFTARRTMQAAQKLFERGYITYHRTDSFNLAPQFIEAVRNYVADQFGKKYLPDNAYFYKTKSANAQEAHEAIRPTAVTKSPKSLKKNDMNTDELKVYSMVWKRAVECQMLPAIYDQTSISIMSKNEYEFRASGSVIKFDGWLVVGKYLSISEDDDEVKPLADFAEGEAVLLKNLLSEQHFTQPPARYSDATLIKQLEELGIGRPSTYAPTISTIQGRGYVEKDGRYFFPTDVAYVVIDLLVTHFPDVVDYKFTAHMEEELDEIADGKKEWEPVIEEFYTPFEKEVTEKDKILSKADITNLGTSDEICPECGKPLVFKLGKYGKFLSCSGYPECTYAKPLSNGENAEEENADYGKCPNCEDGHFIMKHGKFGKFLACSNYPKCKTTKPFLQKIGMKCPKCGEGDVIVKKTKRRIFYGCSRYPDCDFASWTKPKEGKEDEKREAAR
jgi:DNA topoisomerase I